ncbi:MAG: acetylornithine deacetylase/succinyl-diaminopimelate desuccinylase family protein [Pseudomonadota bacterium]
MLSSFSQRIESKRHELVALTQELIRIPTVNPPGEYYQPCAELIGRRLAARGFQVHYERAHGAVGDSDRFPRINVIARKEGRSPGPCVHFNGHIDVVDVGPGWTMDPFAADIRDGKLYGRGSCDMKGGLAAAIIAVETLLEAQPDFPGAVEISGTADEESGGFGGVAYLARQGFFSKPRVDHVIIPEPLNVDRVCLGHRGVWWAEVETKGRPAHGSMPFLGDCAVRHMTAFLRRVEDELFPKLAKQETAMPVVPESARRSTLNFNSLHGGQPEGFDGLPSPMVPDSCRLTLDRRFLIEESLDQVKDEVIGILEDLRQTRDGFDYDIRDIMEVLPLMTERGAPVAHSVAQAIEQVLGRAPEFVISPGTYDQKHIARIGQLDDCIAYGPGILDLAHQDDEFVVIEDMVQSAKVMALATHQLLNGAAG